MAAKNKFDREDIIEIAFAYVRENGWEGLSARYLAQRMNSSTMPIYSSIGSMANLEEEVVKKALALFNTYLTAETTGDKWLDHAIGYVRFAVEEKMLFRCINDEKHTGLQRKNAREMWVSFGDALSDDPRFQEMSRPEMDRIRVMRWFFIHGFSTLVNNGWFTTESVDGQIRLKEMDARLDDLIRMANQALYEGLKANDIFKAIGTRKKGPEKTDFEGE